jgi:hypothetical protein
MRVTRMYFLFLLSSGSMQARLFMVLGFVVVVVGGGVLFICLLTPTS